MLRWLRFHCPGCDTRWVDLRSLYSRMMRAIVVAVTFILADSSSLPEVPDVPAGSYQDILKSIFRKSAGNHPNTFSSFLSEFFECTGEKASKKKEKLR